MLQHTKIVKSEEESSLPYEHQYETVETNMITTAAISTAYGPERSREEAQYYS